jgi:type IV pilus assembly protein PilB
MDGGMDSPWQADTPMSTPSIRDGIPQLTEMSIHPGAKFGLPPVPPAVGRELSLDNAPVVVFKMQGEPLHGFLKNFNPIGGTLNVVLKNKTQVNLDFDQLRFLVFSRPLLPPLEESLQAEERQAATSPHAGRALELLFTDGKKFHATAETVTTDAHGIHIFLDKPDGHIYRVFAPKNTVKKYNFETQLGKGIVEHREVLTEQVETPHPHEDRRDHEDRRHYEVRRIDDGLKQAEAFRFARGKEGSVLAILPPVTNSDELKESLKRRWPLPSQHLGELLIAQHIVTEDQIHTAITAQMRSPGTYLGDILTEQGAATSEEVCGTLAYKLGLSFVKLASFDIDPRTLGLFPRELAIRHHLLPLFLDDGHLVVAMSDPTNADAVKMAAFITEHHIEVAVATKADIEAAVDKYYGRHEDEEVFSHIEEYSEITEESEMGQIKEAERLSKEKPIVRLVHNIIIDAIRSKASDIHIRPGENKVDLMFRIDGTLVAIRRFGKAIHAAVVSRIKIIGRMDISERRVPQDGRANVNLHGNAVDLRISVMPTVNGESVVIRILDTSSGLREIDQLGFGERDYNLFRDMISHSYGILLVTGPTGSGKSTTLYAGIGHIRKTNVNIITVEDPVEYHIDGIEQMQVNSKIGYTFARILRNILRHDPDVIMVGEIRDQETAKTAIESALTGHLVLSTLHTNSAAVTVSRLLEMGVEPYLINDTLLGVLAQRLVRVNCPHCIEAEQVAPEVYEALGVTSQEQFYRGRGCEQCNNTGYKGRMAVYELLQMTPAIRSHVLRGVSADVLHSQAVADGMLPLTQNALDAAREKKTSLAEVYRVRLT